MAKAAFAGTKELYKKKFTFYIGGLGAESELYIVLNWIRNVWTVEIISEVALVQV